MERYTYRNHSTGEIVGGMIWLSLGALVSVLLEVVYLGAWLQLPGGSSIPFPITILIAFFFTMVLSRTALLWSEKFAVASIPLWVWILGFLTLTFGGALGGDILVGSNLRSMLLLLAGVAGGAWPLMKSKVTE